MSLLDLVPIELVVQISAHINSSSAIFADVFAKYMTKPAFRGHYQHLVGVYKTLLRKIVLKDSQILWQQMPFSDDFLSAVRHDLLTIPDYMDPFLQECFRHADSVTLDLLLYFLLGNDVVVSFDNFLDFAQLFSLEAQHLLSILVLLLKKGYVVGDHTKVLNLFSKTRFPTATPLHDALIRNVLIATASPEVHSRAANIVAKVRKEKHLTLASFMTIVNNSIVGLKTDYSIRNIPNARSLRDEVVNNHLFEELQNLLQAYMGGVVIDHQRVKRVQDAAQRLQRQKEFQEANETLKKETLQREKELREADEILEKEALEDKIYRAALLKEAEEEFLAYEEILEDQNYDDDDD